MHVLFVQCCCFELHGWCNLVHSPKYYSSIFVDQFAKVCSCQNFLLYSIYVLQTVNILTVLLYWFQYTLLGECIFYTHPPFLMSRCFEIQKVLFTLQHVVWVKCEINYCNAKRSTIVCKWVQRAATYWHTHTFKPTQLLPLVYYHIKHSYLIKLCMLNKNTLGVKEVEVKSEAAVL